MRNLMVPVPSTSSNVRFITLILFGIIASLLTFSIYAQSAAPPVTLNFVASDKKGNPVTNLQAGDIEVTEGGTGLHVTDLRLSNPSSAPDHSALVTLVFDQLESGNAKNARDAALELLKDAPATGMSFAVFKVDGRLRLLSSFTADREALKTAIDDATGFGKSAAKDCDAAEKQITEDAKHPGARRAPAQMLMAAMLESQRKALNAHITPSVAALLGAAGTPAALPGRRSVIYFSQGLSYYRDAPETVREIIDAANRHDVEIYSIDAHVLDSEASSAMLASVAIANAGAGGNTGIAAAGGQGGPSAAGAGTDAMVGEQMGRVELGDLGFSGPPLEGIARATGGLHAVTSGDLHKNLRKIVEDLTAYYVATVSPSAVDGRFHRITVKALRAGVVVRAPAGYFASVPAAPAVSKLETRLVETLAQTSLPGDITFRTGVLRFGPTPAGVSHSLIVETPGSAARLAVLAQVRDRSGTVIEKFSQDLSAPDSVAQSEAGALPPVVTVQRHFSVPPGTYTLEAAVADPASGKSGAMRSNFEIPASEASPALSDIVLVQRIEPFQGAGDALDPLRCAEGVVVPELSAHVSRALTPVVTLFFQIRKDLKAGHPKLSAEVRRDGVLIGTVPLSLNQESQEEVVPYLAKLGTASLKPGAFQVTVILEQGAAKASRGVAFQLE